MKKIITTNIMILNIYIYIILKYIMLLCFSVFLSFFYSKQILIVIFLYHELLLKHFVIKILLS